MSIKSTMDAWGRDYLQREKGVEIPEGTSISFEDYLRHSGGCPTCGYTTYQVEISCWLPPAKNGHQKIVQAYWNGSLSYLIREISGWEEEELEDES